MREESKKTRLSFGLVKNVLQLLHIHRTTNTHRHKHICIHPKIHSENTPLYAPSQLLLAYYKVSTH